MRTGCGDVFEKIGDIFELGVAGAFVVEAGQQGVLEPFVGRVALGLGMRIIGLQGIVDDDQIAAATG